MDILSHGRLTIAGPCSAESREQILDIAQRLSSMGGVDMLRAGVWKPRTNPNSFEGMGDVALEWLQEAKTLTGLPMVIEVATAQHAKKALEAGVDAVWIGARTTNNPFSVQEIAEAMAASATPVLVKNPTSADVGLWVGAVERLQRCGVENIVLVHRGFSGYNSVGGFRNAPLWGVALEMKQRMPQLPMLCDPSHICGNRTGLLSVSQQAADLDYAGLMIECHPTPDSALSDAEQQITPEELKQLLGSIVWKSTFSESALCKSELEQLRATIDRLDDEIFALIARRMDISDRIGALKRDHNMTILQSNRWMEVVGKVTARAEQLGLGKEFTTKILDAIHLESIERQKR